MELVMQQYHITELLRQIMDLLEKKQTARVKHSGIGYGGL